MEVLIPVAVASATVLALLQILFGGGADRDRGIRNPDHDRPRG